MAGTINPKPSFHLCPDFSIAPPPFGHLQLGSILEDLDMAGILAPLNIGQTIPVPESQLLPRDKPMEKTGFSRSLRELRNLEGSIWAKIFGWDGLGGVFSFLRQRENDETLTVEKLAVRYFIPETAYVKKALESDGVAFYVKHNRFKKPVYMITGIMWTEGAKLSKSRSNSANFQSQISMANANSHTSGGVQGACKSADTLSSSFDGSTPFVLGIRVRKIWWDKEGTRREAYSTVGATLGTAGGEINNMLHGMKFIDDEVDHAGRPRVFDETQAVGIDPIIWILPV